MLTPVNFSQQPSAPRWRTASATTMTTNSKLCWHLSIISLIIPSTCFLFHCGLAYQFSDTMSLPLRRVMHSLHSRETVSNPVNLTALRTEIAPGWVAGPGGRGTWDILYSCLFTLLLCVYTAIHLNMPPPDDTKFAFWRRKTTSVAIAVFAPEIVVVNAFRQWRVARGFVKELNEIAVKNNDEKFKVRFRCSTPYWRFNNFVAGMVQSAWQSFRYGVRTFCCNGRIRRRRRAYSQCYETSNYYNTRYNILS